MGRPSTYTQEIADVICSRLAAGESLLRICKDEGMPERHTIAYWAIHDVEGFSTKYTRARDQGLDVMADEVAEVAASAVDKEDIPRARLEFDAKRWYLSKLAPKRYGDRIEQNITGTGPGGSVTINILPVKTEDGKT